MAGVGEAWRRTDVARGRRVVVVSLREDGLLLVFRFRLI